MPQPQGDQAKSAELDLVSRAIRRDEAAIRAIIQANNRRLYRIARSIVGDDGEAEDVLQEAYLRAFASLSQFRGEARLTTWLTRIVLNEALQRKRRRTDQPVAEIEHHLESRAEIIPFPLLGNTPVNPEQSMARRQISEILERAIDELPEDFRIVLVARAIEDLSTEETADLLGLRPETVKTRLHRARKTLKLALEEHIGPMFSDVFPFEGKRCQRITDAVVCRLKAPSP